MKDFMAVIGILGAIALGIVILSAIGALTVLVKLFLFIIGVFIIGGGIGLLMFYGKIKEYRE